MPAPTRGSRATPAATARAATARALVPALVMALVVALSGGCTELPPPGSAGPGTGAPSAAPPIAPAPPTVPAATPAPGPAGDRPKVILDADFGELNDDSQALFLLLQRNVDVLGVTTVSGNTWSAEGAAYAQRQLQLENRPTVPVAQGSADPLMGDRSAELPAESQLFGVDTGYSGAWDHPRPPDARHLAKAPYGGYPDAAPGSGNAVDFLVAQITAHPHQVTLFAIGPATNIALAVKAHPEIVPLVKQVIYMAGAFDVPGNQGPAAEFNVWFDPEAARIAFTTPFPDQLVVPLDVTDTVYYGKAEYDRIVAGPATPITAEFRALQGPRFAQDAGYRTHLWDALAAAVFLRPNLITRSEVRGVTVDTVEGPDHGRTLGFPLDHAPRGVRPVRIVQGIDIPAFYDLYVGAMTAPVAP